METVFRGDRLSVETGGHVLAVLARQDPRLAQVALALAVTPCHEVGRKGLVALDLAALRELHALGHALLGLLLTHARRAR